MKGTPLPLKNSGALGRQCFYFESLPSTNDYARQQNALHGTVYIAGTQTAGRGRMGHTWHSPAGDGLWMSVCLKPQLSLDKLALLPLASGLAACRALVDVAPLSPSVKWPNDVVVNGKKIGGILVESATEGGSVQQVVIGFGINTGAREFPPAFGAHATSLFLETGSTADHTMLAEALLQRLDQCLQLLESGPAALLDGYAACCVTIGAQVKAVGHAGTLIGTATGLTPDGALRIRQQDGTERVVQSGEVSVRGLYGYV